MSRSNPTGHTALPLPTGDAAGLLEAAARIRQVSGQAGRTDVVRGRVGPALAEVWNGPAATAASTEAAVLAGRARAMLSGIPVASTALERYAAALGHATGTTRALQVRWDAAQHEHRRALARVHAAAGLGSPEQVVLIERLRSEHRATLAGLESLHEHCLSELRSAAAECAAALQRVSTEAFPHARGTGTAEVRSQVIGGLTLAGEAAQAIATRHRALAAAAAWRRLGPDAGPEEVDSWLSKHATEAADPSFAQTFLEEVGVRATLATITELARTGGPATPESIQSLIMTMGTLLLSATVPPAQAQGSWGRRRVVLSADLIRRDLVGQMSVVFASADGRTHHSGSWLVGQLLVGARQAGLTTPFPDVLLTQLASAAAHAEIEESRDADLDRRNGTTLRPNGQERFASFFPEATTTGDVLHQLLGEAQDVASQKAVLGAPVRHASLTNLRGGDLVLADYLVRRWITHDNTSVASDASSDPTTTAAPLETDVDLVRLMRAATGDGTLEAAALRARVMAEISRTNGHARQEYATIQRYEIHTAALEEEAMGWLLAMPESVSDTLEAPDPTGAFAWLGTDGHHPRLRLDELTGLLAAFAVDENLGLDGRAPAATYRRLIDGELERLRPRSAHGAAEEDVRRIGFYDAAASAALTETARSQDAVNRSMWTTLAEAKNVVISGRVGSLSLADSLHGLVVDGTTRTALDELVISTVTSDVAGRQAETNDARSASLSASIRAALAEQSLSWSPDLLLAAGRALAPPTPTGAQARAARDAALLHGFNAYLDEHAVSRLWRELVPDPPESVDRLEIALGRDGPLHEFQALPPGKTKRVRLVDSETELVDLHSELTRDARLIPSRTGDHTYWMERPDGIQVSLRVKSKSGGATIDLKFPDGTERRVHIRGHEPTRP